MRFEIVPLVGVSPVRLGMSRDQVRSAMGVVPEEFQKTASSAYPTDVFHDGFHVYYAGDEPIAEFIELSRDCGFEAFLDGIDVFGIPADELIVRLAQISAFDQDDPELGYSYVFPERELALWRPVFPGEDGNEEDQEGDEGRYFATVGVGVQGYFSKAER